MRFIARQPIFDSGLHVFGYELLFRAGMEEFARIADANRAACTTLDNSVVWGIDRLCEGRLAFVNCTRELITSGVVQVLPPGSTVLEVLEWIDADREMISSCRALIRNGYVIALDDVSSIREVEPYAGVAQMAKVDFRLTTPTERVEIARWLRRWGITPLAEKVQTRQEFRAAVAMGFELFQGFFLQRPQLIRARDIPTLQVNHVRIIQAVQHAELDFEAVEEAIRSEPSLCFRLLRYLNSPLFAFDHEIDSIRHGLQLLGERNVRNWLLVAVASAVGEGKPSELVVWALTRARFCELIAKETKASSEGMFLTGMLSAFPPLLETSLENILDRLTIAPPIRAALLGSGGAQGDILRLAVDYEAGDWANCRVMMEALRIPEEAVSTCYLDAAAWSDQVSAVGRGAARRSSGQPCLATP